ncbi:SMP-30/gluconolactonase/LRE family protein [Pseudoruegeria sp. SHC-113]|uniref:SMP-30/gluconolactonase/LRE family protein n=1 Tax=Pseudoruegeria sp. SHC-113 TaxID=2855439 RepID=UPI0021BB0257|nr:SMP-30/gluconolactonase/LRE family protein [Pseudoruegeria sp. SHC-113]MCT8158674.1 SMP-30/gluconolactonase/LRE family protein [Pseudoruegeria sp. SHC-113]
MTCDTSFTALAQPLATTGESPLWDAERGGLWWIDIQAQRLLFTTPDGTTTATPTPGQPGFVAHAASGRLVVGLEYGLFAHDPASGAWEQLSDTEADRPTLRLNDGKADRHGRLWFGSMDMSGTGQANGRLYRRDADGSVHVMREGIRVPNGIVPLPDDRLLFTDSPTKALQICAIDPPSGALSDWQTVLTTPQAFHTDGAVLDAEGHIWAAMIGAGEVWRFTVAGEILAKLACPVTRPTMPALGGGLLWLTNQRRFLNAEALAQQPLAGALLARAEAVLPGPEWRVAGA